MERQRCVCGKVIKGPAYYKHAKTCLKARAAEVLRQVAAKIVREEVKKAVGT